MIEELIKFCVIKDFKLLAFNVNKRKNKNTRMLQNADPRV